jgi:pimeloyl-ACP methyl ester carboxylesterase
MVGMTVASHLVVLIPGFLGFDRLGDFAYFRDTVGDAIRAGLASLGIAGGVAVDAATTDPAGSLETRQERLVRELHGFLERRPGVKLHLVGHSTGGLDAELLLRTPLLGSGHRFDERAREVRAAIRSVITLAAPLAGTTVSDSPIARLFAIQTPAEFLEALQSKLLYQAPGVLASVASSILALLHEDTEVAPLIYGVLRRPDALGSYVLELILQRSLAIDLAPAAITKLLKDRPEDPALASVHRARFITIARPEPDVTPAGKLFAMFYDATRKAAQPDAGVAAIGAALEQRALAGRLRVIGEPPLPTPIDVGASDGIVNSARQLFASPPEASTRELDRAVALVIADHIDVIGYFEGKNGAPNGFLSSGSGFREPAFRELYLTVATELSKAMG